jgi:spermidine synthase
MLEQVYVEKARAESERGEIVLRERRTPEGPGALELRVYGVVVMDTLETTSERALATEALARVEGPRRVLVGGLGLGFTMHEVLADRRVEKVAVVEIEDALVGWMKDGTVPHGPSYLADERVTVVVADIAVAINEAAPGSYDLILLDVDNGPDFLVYDANDAVYQADFLTIAAEVIDPSGALVVWSSSQSSGLAAAIGEAFRHVEEIPYEVDLQGRPERYWLYLGRHA